MTKWKRIGYFSGVQNTGKSKIGPYAACLGVGSVLKDEESVSKGHVFQADLDDFTGSIDGLFESADLPDGVYLVTRTDADSYNITSLNLFTRGEVIDAKAELKADDAQHLKIGVKRGYWILRLSCKGSRERPKFERLKVVNNNDTRMDYSMPHVELYNKVYSDIGLYDCLPEGKQINGSLKLENYATKVE